MVRTRMICRMEIFLRFPPFLFTGTVEERNVKDLGALGVRLCWDYGFELCEASRSRSLSSFFDFFRTLIEVRSWNFLESNTRNEQVDWVTIRGLIFIDCIFMSEGPKSFDYWFTKSSVFEATLSLLVEVVLFWVYFGFLMTILSGSLSIELVLSLPSGSESSKNFSLC